MTLKMIKLMYFDQVITRQDVWLKCLTRRYALAMSLLGKALKKDSLIDSEENGKHSGTSTHLYY